MDIRYHYGLVNAFFMVSYVAYVYFKTGIFVSTMSLVYILRFSKRFFLFVNSHSQVRYSVHHHGTIQIRENEMNMSIDSGPQNTFWVGFQPFICMLDRYLSVSNCRNCWPIFVKVGTTIPSRNIWISRPPTDSIYSLPGEIPPQKFGFQEGNPFSCSIIVA